MKSAKLWLNEHFAGTKVKVLDPEDKIKTRFIASMNDRTLLGGELRVFSQESIVWVKNTLDSNHAGWMFTDKIIEFENATLQALYGKN